MRNKRPILLIEDDFVDALTVKRALKDIEVPNELIHKENGEDAFAFLKNKQNNRPCIILLDLNMPRMNGLEFLEKVKKDDQTKSIPIVVLTTSTEQKDRLESFNYSVAGYMVKPLEYGKFLDMMRAISRYWSTSELP